MKNLLNIASTATIVGVSKSHINRLAERGDIPSFNYNGETLFLEEDVHEFAHDQEAIKISNARLGIMSNLRAKNKNSN